MSNMYNTVNMVRFRSIDENIEMLPQLMNDLNFIKYELQQYILESVEPIKFNSEKSGFITVERTPFENDFYVEFIETEKTEFIVFKYVDELVDFLVDDEKIKKIVK